MSQPAIGIDLGTSTSEICAYIDGKPVPIIDPATKSPVMPSVVAMSRTGELMVGQMALDRGLPETIVRESKRGTGTSNLYTMGDRSLTSEQIAALILRKLKSNAEVFLGQPIEHVTISVPANYDDTRRRAVRDAADMAGLSVDQLINEPTAAALAYGVTDTPAMETLLVYDFGGGTLDVTILEMVEGVLDVKTSHGVEQLGGKDFDEKVCVWARDRFGSANPGAQVEQSPANQERLKRAAEGAKRELSEAQTASVFVPNCGTRSGVETDMDAMLTRQEFEGLVRPLVDESLRAIDAALAKGGISRDSITRILLVGGTTYVPCVREAAARHLGKPVVPGIDADMAVAAGACLRAAGGVVVQDVTTHGLGTISVGQADGRVRELYDELIPANTSIPFTVKHEHYTLVSVDQDQVEVAIVQDHTGHARFPEDTVPAPGAAGVITGIPPSRTSEPLTVHIECTIDASGIASLTASLPGTGQSLTVRTAKSVDTSKRQGDSAAFSTVDELWSSSPLASQHAALIKRGEEALNGNPPTADAIGRALATLKEKISLNDRDGAQQAREVLLDLLTDL